jgi:uncharacterized protein (UPF0264 family)
MMRRPPDGWRGLLVSVRDADEARAALAGGAAIIDVKEPSHGPLGAADVAVAAAIAAVVGQRVPWTVACGELAAGPGRAAAVAARHARDTPPAGAKAGPAGCAPAEWCAAFAAFAAALPAETMPIAVAYADWQRAAAPPPETIIAAAADVARCGVLLIDTFDKQGPAVLEGTAPDVLRRWISTARAAGLATALAGRLSLETLATAATLGADVLAIRGAACTGGRGGRVQQHLVEAALRRCDTLGPSAVPLRPSPSTLETVP